MVTKERNACPAPSPLRGRSIESAGNSISVSSLTFPSPGLDSLDEEHANNVRFRRLPWGLTYSSGSMIGCSACSGKKAMISIEAQGGAFRCLEQAKALSTSISTVLPAPFLEPNLVRHHDKVLIALCRATEMDITMIGLQNAGKTSLLRVLAVSRVTDFASCPGLTALHREVNLPSSMCHKAGASQDPKHEDFHH